MNSKIIQEIAYLKNNYKNNTNIYEIEYLNLDEKYFLDTLQKIIKSGNKNVKIIDDKEYIHNGMILNIDMNGNMICNNRKMLKYKYIDNVKINLYNDRVINVDNFPGSNNYNDLYKQKRMIFNINNIDLILTIKTRKNPNPKPKKEEDKTITSYEIRIKMNSSINEKDLEVFTKYL